MATYIPGVQSYMPDMKPFTPDYQFLGNILDVKTNRYNTNYKAINDLYSNVVYGNLSRNDTKEMRNHFAETLAPKLQQVSGMDLSVMQNAEAARAIFKPFFEDDLIVRDLVVTRQYMDEMGKANAMQSSPSKEIRELYWDTGVKKLQYEMEDFINASAEDALSVKAPEYTPDADLYQRGKAYLEAQGYDVKIDYVDPAMPEWVVTKKNGELVTQQAMLDMQLALLDDPLVQNAYYADAFVQSRDFANQGMQSGQFASVKDGQAAWAANTINQYEQQLAAQNVLLQEEAKNQRAVVSTWDTYKQQQGIIPGSDEEKQMNQLKSSYDATLARIDKNKNVLSDNRGVDSNNLNSLLNRAYNIIMQTNMNTDLAAAATQWASTHNEVTLKANKPYLTFEKQRRDHIHDFEKQRREQVFEWNKALLKAATGGSGSKKSEDGVDPITEYYKNAIKSASSGPQQSEDPLTLADAFAGQGSIFDKMLNDVTIRNEKFLKEKGNEILDSGLDAGLSLYTKLFKNDENKYSIFDLGITGTPEEIKKELLSKPNDAQAFLTKLHDFLNLAEGGTFLNGIGPGMAGDKDVQDNIKVLRKKIGEMYSLNNIDKNIDHQYSLNYEKLLKINPKVYGGKPAQGVIDALKDGVPNVFHEDADGNSVPYTFEEYLPLITKYAEDIGYYNMKGYGLNGNNKKELDYPMEDDAFRLPILGGWELEMERDKWRKKLAGRKATAKMKMSGGLFYDIWKGQMDLYKDANNGTLNEQTSDGTVMFPIYNARMRYEGYSIDQMNEADQAQTSTYKSFFNPRAIEDTQEGAAEYITLLQQYTNKGPASDYVIDFYSNGQKFQQNLAKEVFDELINNVQTQVTDPKNATGLATSMDIVYIPHANANKAAQVKNTSGETSTLFQDAAAYKVRLPAEWMKKIMKAKTAKGALTSPTLLATADIGGYNEIIFTFPKSKDQNPKKFATQEMLSTTLLEIDENENKQIVREYPMGGKAIFRRDHMNNIVVDLQMSQYDTKTGNHVLLPVISKNLTEEWLQSGAGQNWYDYKANSILNSLQENSTTQSDLQKQNKQKKSNQLEK